MKSKLIRILSENILILAVFLLTAQLHAADLQAFNSCVLKENKSNDGDSFHVVAGDRHLLVRLYFVDCPETSAWAKSDARRLGEQMNHFGLPSVVDTVHFGKLAARFTRDKLSKPFTLYTAFAGAPGRSAVKRIYGFVETDQGEDLASLLVANGLARTYGVRRKTPHGIAHDEMVLRLGDMEAAAMLKRSGIWAKSDPERIVALRAQQRIEEKRLVDIQVQVTASGLPTAKIDLNSADRAQLEAVKGIGPSLAAKIVAARPFSSVAELKTVKGIGEEKYKQLSPHFFISADKK